MTGAHGNQVVNGGTFRPGGGGAVGILETLPEGRVAGLHSVPSTVITESAGRTAVLAKVQSAAVTSNGSVQRQTILTSMAAVPTSGNAAATGQAVPLPQGMQIMNVRPAQGNIVQPQQVRSITPRMILSSQMIQNVRTGQPGVLPSTPGGHLLVKTENGQMHLVRVNHTPGQGTQPGGVTVGGGVTTATLPATSHVTLNQVATSNNAAVMAANNYRYQQSQVNVVSSSNPVSSASYVNVTAAAPALTSVVSTINNFTPNNIISNNNTNNNIINNAAASIMNSNNTTQNNLNNSSITTSNNLLTGATIAGVTSASSSTALSSGTVMANSIQLPTSQQQQPLVVNQQQQQISSHTISAESAEIKCKNFLATLLKLASEQKQPVAKNVRNLIQGLIDSRVEPEAFTEELQKDLNSSPQPCLVPFLKKTLPYLRVSLARGDIHIEGVNPPPLNNTASTPANTTVIPTMSVRGNVGEAATTTAVRLVATTLNSGAAAAGGGVGVMPGTTIVRPVQQQQQHVVQHHQHHITTTTSLNNNNSNHNNNPSSHPTILKATVSRPPLLSQQQQIRLPAKTATTTIASNNNSVGVVRLPTAVLVQQQQPVTTSPAVVSNSSSSNISTTTVGVTNASIVQQHQQQQQHTVLTPVTPITTSAVSSPAPVQQQQQQQQQQQSSSTTTTTTTKINAVVNSNKLNNTKDRVKEKQSFASYNVADDDINDVAAMGGVNLGEESQRILESTGFVGTHIRSCKDETFLQSQPLAARLKQICAKHDMDEPNKEFTLLLSHAVQERLKTIVEKLSIISEHRLDIVKNETRYEPIQDVKGQLRFLEDLDRLEKKRKDEMEREMLLRAAKSRNKNEDPEQAKLKAKAKEMQRVEMEEMRQRDANMAALKALQGPKKKAKLELQTPDEGGTYSGTFSQKQIPLRQRTKRVNLRDLTFLMEQEKDMNKSSLLYRTYLK